MTTDSIRMRPPIMSYMGYVGRGLALLIVLAVAGLAFVINYWLGIGILFLGLLIWIILGFKDFQGRNLLLLLYTLALVAVVSSSIAYTRLAPEEALAQGTLDLSALVNSLLVGIVASFATFVFIFLVITVATLGVLKWHKYQDVSFFQAFWYLLSVTLGLRYLWIVVDDKKIQGDEDDKKRLETFGGPGWLTVYPGHVVVLHQWGKITRVVEPGSTMLERHEKIKAVLSLDPAGNVQTLENVLTKDRVPLTLTVLHAVRLEPAEATEKRGAVTGNDRPIGDEYDKCYESIARLAAQKAASDMWGAVKFPIANTVRDLIMTCDFEDLFSVSQDDGSQGLEVRVNQRKLTEIERIVAEKASGAGLKKGVMLLMVDINGIEYPEEIKDKINKQVTAHLDGKIRQDEAKARKLIAKYDADALEINVRSQSQARVEAAKSKETAAQYRIRAITNLADAEAQAERIREEAKIKVRAEYYKKVVEELTRQKLPPEIIKAIVENLVSSTALEDQLKQAIGLATQIQRQAVHSIPKQTNSG